MEVNDDTSAEAMWLFIESEMITIMNEDTSYVLRAQLNGHRTEEMKELRKSLNEKHVKQWLVVKGLYCEHRQKLMPLARRQEELFEILESIINKEAEDLLLGSKDV